MGATITINTEHAALWYPMGYVVVKGQAHTARTWGKAKAIAKAHGLTRIVDQMGRWDESL